jgi:flavodoxin
MKVLVTYYSKTKNTEKLAKSIFEAIVYDKKLAYVDEVVTMDDFDLIFIGFPVQAHSVPLPAQKFIDRVPEGKHVAFFSTHGSLRGGRLPKQAFEHAFSLAKKLRVLGHFGARGRVESWLLESLKKKPEHEAWVEEALGAYEHPNEADLQDAQHFALEMINKFRRFSGTH